MAMACCSPCFFPPPAPLLSPSDHSSAGTPQLLLPPRKLGGLFMKVPLPGSNRWYLSGISFRYALPPIKPLLSDLNTRAKPFSDHQALSTALLMENALLLTCPMKALAETCEADSSFFNMPVLLFVALVGATVGEKRRTEARLNEQLRQINAALRRQAKIESYALALSYAPVGSRIAETEVIVDPNKDELMRRLKSGKNYLRNQDPEKPFLEFQVALKLARTLHDRGEEGCQRIRSISSEAGKVLRRHQVPLNGSSNLRTSGGRTRETQKLRVPSQTVTPSLATSSGQAGFVANI